MRYKTYIIGITIKIHLGAGKNTVYETRVEIALYNMGTDVYTDITHYIIHLYDKLYYYYYIRVETQPYKTSIIIYTYIHSYL